MRELRLVKMKCEWKDRRLNKDSILENSEEVGFCYIEFEDGKYGLIGGLLKEVSAEEKIIAKEKGMIEVKTICIKYDYSCRARMEYIREV